MKSTGFNQFMQSFKSQEQMLKYKKQEDENLKRAKQLIAQQKYQDAR
jgi:hypothetical protein